MGYTKEQLIDAAFAEIGLAVDVFDISPADRQHALRELDAMLAEWNAQGIRLGYPVPGSPQNSTLSSESGIPDAAYRAVYANLAIGIADSYGKIVSKRLEVKAHRGYNTLLSRASTPPTKRFSRFLPKGAGNRRWFGNRDPFLPEQTQPLDAGNDAELDLT